MARLELAAQRLVVVKKRNTHKHSPHCSTVFHDNFRHHFLINQSRFDGSTCDVMGAHAKLNSLLSVNPAFSRVAIAFDSIYRCATEQANTIS